MGNFIKLMALLKAIDDFAHEPGVSDDLCDYDSGNMIYTVELTLPTQYSGGKVEAKDRTECRIHCTPTLYASLLANIPAYQTEDAVVSVIDEGPLLYVTKAIDPEVFGIPLTLICIKKQGDKI